MPESTPTAEILWDTWGVPHIYAPTDAAAFRALGWAQMQAHGDLLLHLYGLARGRAAEYWGERYLESDRLIRRMGIPGRSAGWIEDQDPAMRENLAAFVAGLNAQAAAYPEALAPEVQGVLPVTLEDLFSHIQRVYFVYLTSGGQRPAGEPYNDLIPTPTLLPDAPQMGTGIAGSNAWTLAGSRTASGRPVLLANPHLYWGDSHTFFEAHLNVGDDFSLYGVAQVGWPVLRYGFNDHLGWAHTVNTLKGWDAFALDVQGETYRLDGTWHPFGTLQETLRVRQPDGTLREEALTIRESAHGPLVTESAGRPVAVRCVGLDVSPIAGIFGQYWAMARAQDHAEFEAALARHQNAMFTVLYADRAGHTAQYFTGLIPVRPSGDWHTWAGTLPGDDSALIWQRTHPFSDLPRVTDPPSGWLQNANNPPWLTTLPAALDPRDYPAYFAPQMITPREQRSIRLVSSLMDATLDDVAQAIMDTRSETADRLLPPLLAAAQTSQSDLVRRAADVLARWDRRYDPQSVGADLFARTLLQLGPSRTLENVTAESWNPLEPLDTPRGLRDPGAALRALEAAASSLLRDAGSLERRWGELTQARRGAYRVPGHGHLDPFGVFRVSGYAPDPEGGFLQAFGTTYVAAVEFTDPPRAQVLLAYGNASQPTSPHLGDQLPLYARGEMRDALLTREAVERSTVRREEV